MGSIIDKLENRIVAIEDNKNNETTKRKRNCENPAGGKTSEWGPVREKNQSDEEEIARQMRKARLEEESRLRDSRNQEKAAAEATGRRLEAQTELKKKEELEKAKKPVKLGDSGNLHNIQDWDWEESSEDWQDTVDRAARNEAKKKAAKLKQMETDRKLLTKLNTS